MYLIFSNLTYKNVLGKFFINHSYTLKNIYWQKLDIDIKFIENSIRNPNPYIS
jgi:hypothetical protein